MTKSLFALCVFLTFFTAPVLAEERVTLGWGRIFTNDIFGDTRDRWRTGSFAVSRIRGVQWQGELPLVPGALLEFRVAGETIAPADLVAPDATDRRYVGALALGLHTHFDWLGLETSLGGNLVLTGPQTGASALQSGIHDVVGLPEPQVFGDQIGNGVHPTVVLEIGKPIGALRPFAEAQAGVETFVRAGVDLHFGGYTHQALILRDGPSGQRYRALAGNRTTGYSASFGGDVAHVLNSRYFLNGDAAQATDTRARLRAGLHWQGDRTEMSYGITWLGKEFTTQADTQILGSIDLRLNF